MNKLFLFCAVAAIVSFSASVCLAAVTSDGSKPVYKPELLEEIVKQVEKLAAEKKTPVVVFDLDSTLFNNAPRNRKIIEEFAAENAAKLPDFAKAVAAMKEDHLAYSLEETFKNIGVSDEKILKDLKKVWYDKFFTDKYVVLDKAYEGASDYVKKLHSKGAKVVYLTGRDTPDMEKGTIQSLKESGFPLDANAVLMTKPEKKIKDDEYKKTASEDIKKLGQIVASIDNEPKNVNLFKTAFPGAIILFLETNHSPKAVPVDKDIPWFRSWK